MKNPILKSILRRPIKFIILIVILSLVSSAFTMNLISFLLVNDEIETAKSEYNSIGFFLFDSHSNDNIYELVELLRSDPMIDYENNKEYNVGISNALINSDYNNLGEFYNNEAMDFKYFGRDLFVIVNTNKTRMISAARKISDGIVIETKVKELLAGYPDWIYLPDGEMFKDGLFNIVVPKYDPSTRELLNYIDEDIINELYDINLDTDYLFRCERVPGIEYSYKIKPLFDGGPLYEKIDTVNFNINDSKWDTMREDMELVDAVNRTFDIAMIKDMNTYPPVQNNFGSMYLLHGRWLNYDDYKNANNVCVIEKNLFEVRKLELGDEIPIELIESETGYFYTKNDRENWKDYYRSDEIKYEIVGVFNNYSSGKEIYVPESTIPDRFKDSNHIHPSQYSFVLKNPAEQNNFINTYEEIALQNEVKLQFIENNAESFWTASNKVTNNLKTNIFLYGLLLFGIMIFIAYLYLENYKSYYFINRILGITHRDSSVQIFLPIFGMSIIGIMGSSIYGYQNAVTNSRKILSELLTEASEISTGDSMKFAVIIAILLISIFSIIILLGTLSLKRQSLLGFFSKKKSKAYDDYETDSFEIKTEALSDIIDFKDIKLIDHKDNKYLKKYSKLNIRRSLTMTVLILVVTILLSGSLLFVSYLIDSNNTFIEESITNTEIRGNIVFTGQYGYSDKGNISQEIINKLINTNYVEDYFLSSANHYDELVVDRNGELEKIVKVDYSKWQYYDKIPFMMIIASNQDINSPEGMTVSLEEDNGVTERFNSYNRKDEIIPVLSSKAAAKTFNIDIGDKVYLRHRGENTPKRFGEVIGIYNSFNYPAYDSYSSSGVIGSTEIEQFIYPLDAIKSFTQGSMYYSKAEFLFDQDKNVEFYNNRDEVLNTVLLNKYNSRTGYKLVLNDDTLIETIKPLQKNLELLDIIYPILLIISLTIAVVLPYLIILRRSEEFSIMRILGVDNKSIEKYVFREIILLVSTGLIIAILIIIALSYGNNVYPIIRYIFIIASYIVASIIGILVSTKTVLNRKPLDMLQVKE
ncbi:MAG: hypothetical protein GXZ08_07705 [Tissierellia bacterium]|nr:hypothetical protein [Tissierellia bacterium]